MKKVFFIFLLLLGFISPALAKDQGKSVYDRVMESKTLRCGYLPYEPWVSVDPNSGTVSGITREYMDAVGATKGITVEWTGEVNIDQAVPAIEAGRFDAICIPSTPDHNWEKVLNFSGYLGGLPYFVYVPKDSNATDETLKTARFATQDGFALTDITKTSFPQAQYIELPQTTSTAELYSQLRFGKADALVNEHISASLYMKNNPSVIRRYSDKPVIAMRMFLASKVNDEAMAKFLDNTFSADLPENLSLMKEILKRHGMQDGTLLLGEECANRAVTSKGDRICADPDLQTDVTEKKD